MSGLDLLANTALPDINWSDLPNNIIIDIIGMALKAHRPKGCHKISDLLKTSNIFYRIGDHQRSAYGNYLTEDSMGMETIPFYIALFDYPKMRSGKWIPKDPPWDPALKYTLGSRDLVRVEDADESHNLDHKWRVECAGGGWALDIADLAPIYTLSIGESEDNHHYPHDNHALGAVNRARLRCEEMRYRLDVEHPDWRLAPPDPELHRGACIRIKEANDILAETLWNPRRQNFYQQEQTDLEFEDEAIPQNYE